MGVNVGVAISVGVSEGVAISVGVDVSVGALNSGIESEGINGIPGIRWNWFQNVQHCGIGCILETDTGKLLYSKFLLKI